MRNLWRCFLFGSLFFVMAFGFLGSSNAEEENKDIYASLELFGEVFGRVKDYYVEDVGSRELITHAIEGMLQGLDPHSSYLSPESFAEMQIQTSGQFGGLGIEVTMENGLVKVIAPLDGTPADRAGLRSGDLITHLDGVAVLGMTLNDAIQIMRGEPGAPITLRIFRANEEPFSVKLIREIITIRPVRSHLEETIGYVRISSFNSKTSETLLEMIEEMEAELPGDLEGLVLDLRNNPGGLLDQAVQVSNAFLSKGEIVSVRGRLTQAHSRFQATEGDLLNGKPMVVLINSGTASASEIVAGALQDHRRALIMGTRSFGKGSVQTLLGLKENGGIRLTTARYYTPSGKSIQARGISPDVEVVQSRVEAIEGVDRHRESSFRHALSAETPDSLQTEEAGAEESSSSEEAPDQTDEGLQTTSPQDPDDYQLRRAVEFLRAFGLYSEAKQES